MKPGPQPLSRFNYQLALMLANRPPGREYSQREIAKFCGVHHSRLQQIERAAFKKIRERMQPAVVGHEFLEGHLTAML